MASPPLGLAYMAAVLERNGYDVKILDCTAEGFDTVTHYGPGLIAYGLAPEEIVSAVLDYQPSVVGISCLFTVCAPIVERLSELIKEHFPSVKIVLGGTHPTVCAEDLIQKDYVDFVVRGEGEHAFLELLNHLQGTSETSRSFREVCNLTYRESGRIVSTPQQFIRNLDELPTPARHLLNMEFYIEKGLMQGLADRGSRATTMITSRGCPARCVFCSIHSVWGYRYRAHSPNYVLDEVAEIKRLYGVSQIIFEDDNLTLNRRRAEEIFRGMKERKLDLHWTTPNGVALWALNESLLRMMKEAGCVWLTVAFESGDQETLKNIIRKPLNLVKAAELVNICRKIRLPTTAFFVIGFPGETNESMKRSMRFAEDLPVDSISVMIATPYPGTELMNICVQGGYLAKEYQRDKLHVRVGQIVTPDFQPRDVELLASRTMLRRALKHPFGTLRRLWRKFYRSPSDTLRFILTRVREAVLH